MATETTIIRVREFDVEVVRKDIKNIHLATYPPDGRVRIAVPLHIDDDAVRAAVTAKAAWIRRQQKAFNNQARQSPREYVNGESHWVWGQRYRLELVETTAKQTAVIRGKKLKLHVRPGATRDQRAAVLARWYREELNAEVPGLITKWEPVIGANVADWGIKAMRTKWGTCNRDARRIWVNLELAKKTPTCLEYLVVHEMVHLVERGHGDRFKNLMDQFLPDWRLRRDELNHAPLVLDSTSSA